MPALADGPVLLISEWSATLATREGLNLHVRPAAPEDETTVRSFFAELGPDDLRFRFLSPMPRLSESLYDTLLRVDHVRTRFIQFMALGDQFGKLLIGAPRSTQQRRAKHPVCTPRWIGRTTDAQLMLRGTSERQRDLIHARQNDW